MAKDITGIGCPVSSRRKNSPKGCKKDSPKFWPIIAALVGGQMQKDSAKAEEYSKYVPGKYGGKQTGKEMGGGGTLTLDSMKSNSSLDLSTNKKLQEEAKEEQEEKEGIFT